MLPILTSRLVSRDGCDTADMGPTQSDRRLHPEKDVLELVAATPGINTRRLAIQQGLSVDGMAYFTRTRFVPISCAARAIRRSSPGSKFLRRVPSAAQ
jgi:hypothetical protein